MSTGILVIISLADGVDDQAETLVRISPGPGPGTGRSTNCKECLAGSNGATSADIIAFMGG